MAAFTFGPFTFDPSSRELHKDGQAVKLHPQPAQLLGLLARRSGDIVTREEIKEELWSDETYVDFDLGINSSIRQIRAALDDDAEKPLYVQTLPRKGYRFVAPVEQAETTSAGRSWKVAGLIVPGLITLFVLLAWLSKDHLRTRWQGGTGMGEIRSLAVLPLENLSGDPEQEYFVDGMTGELIRVLGKIGTLKVISRTSVMHYKGTDRPLPAIARELDVDGVVEGSVLREGDRVRISAALIESSSDTQIWGDSYERDLRDILKLQSDVAQSIAREVEATLSPEEETRLVAKRSIEPEAYELYLRGQQHLNRRNADDMHTAARYLKQAIDNDLEFAPAYAELAYVYGQLGGPVDYLFPPDEAMRKAKALAEKAIELDPDLADGYASLGWILSCFERDWVGAEASFLRALELNPGMARAHTEYAIHLAQRGRFKESFDEVERAQSYDPLNIRDAVHGMILAMAGRNEEAIARYRATLEMEPDYLMAHRLLGLVYLGKQMYPEAIQAHEAAVSLTNRNSIADMAFLGGAYAAAGKRTEALEILLEIEQYAYVPAFARFYVYLHLADLDQSALWLEKAVEEHSYYVSYIGVSFLDDSHRSDPRFAGLLRCMRLQE